MPQTRYQRIRYAFDNLTIGFFILIIFTPLTVMLLYPMAEKSETELRTLAKFPSLGEQSFDEFIDQFELFFNDHFGLRETFIYWNSYLRVSILSLSPVNSVVIGNDGWWYLDSPMDDYQGLLQFNVEELERWRQHLENTGDWLENQGIGYIFVVAPEKQSIYPEFIPGKYAHSDGETMLDQLINYLAEYSDFRILDLREPLLEAKLEQAVYYQKDTHWNQIGAYIAFESILARIQMDYFPNQDVVDLSLVETRPFVYSTPDLVRMVGLTNSFAEESLSVHLAETCATAEEYAGPPAFGHQNQPPIQMTCSTAELRTVVFRDSFFTSVLPFFAEHFEQSVFLWQYYDQTLLEQLIDYVRPNIVIVEIAERRLVSPP